ncbi:MAG: ATP-binding protein [Chloroflexota bacterium]|nr:ATP-binding protein [Chloroflexota bacterium]
MALSWGLWLALQGRTSNGYSEVALILVLNVVVLAMSDLVHNLRAQRRLAELLDNYTLRLQMPEKTLNLSGDVQYLRLAIDALLDNAIKFSPEGGEITIKLWNEEGKIYLVIKDQGIGVSEQYQAHLFERFYQVDGSTTRQFGKGSTFGFWMPYMHLQASNKIA